MACLAESLMVDKGMAFWCWHANLEPFVAGRSLLKVFKLAVGLRGPLAFHCCCSFRLSLIQLLVHDDDEFEQLLNRNRGATDTLVLEWFLKIPRFGLLACRICSVRSRASDRCRPRCRPRPIKTQSVRRHFTFLAYARKRVSLNFVFLTTFHQNSSIALSSPRQP
nr:hypothetical protein CFP56_70776 [Quercus suber]